MDLVLLLTKMNVHYTATATYSQPHVNGTKQLLPPAPTYMYVGESVT